MDQLETAHVMFFFFSFLFSMFGLAIKKMFDLVLLDYFSIFTYY
jgi:hypothetical protein